MQTGTVKAAGKASIHCCPGTGSRLRPDGNVATPRRHRAARQTPEPLLQPPDPASSPILLKTCIRCQQTHSPSDDPNSRSVRKDGPGLDASWEPRRSVQSLGSRTTGRKNRELGGAHQRWCGSRHSDNGRGPGRPERVEQFHRPYG